MATGSHAIVHDVFSRIRDSLSRVIVGQEDTLRLLLTCLFAKGHCLLIGVPGLAKTLLVRSLAETLHLDFRRIQFTPDLMPADLIGSELIQEHDRRLEFEFQPGPVFASLLLADEINRTPPKTQSALLEAMQERHVTVAGESRPLPDPFLVVATQNPIEQEGTYPLPEAQLDRFMFSITLDYPDAEEEAEIVRRTTLHELPTLDPVVTDDDIRQVQQIVLAAPATDHVVNYAVALVRATRPRKESVVKSVDEFVEWGAGPRASQYLILGAKALALLDGRTTPEVADVQAVAVPVLQRRIITNYRATGASVASADIVSEAVKLVPQEDY